MDPYVAPTGALVVQQFVLSGLLLVLVAVRLFVLALQAVLVAGQIFVRSARCLGRAGPLALRSAAAFLRKAHAQRWVHINVRHDDLAWDCHAAQG